jgi:hypothetical protein
MLPSSAPIFTGDTFYLSNNAQLRILAEDPTPGLSQRWFAGMYFDAQHGIWDGVQGTITATGAVTPGAGGVPISTISFVGQFWAWPAYENVYFTGQVYGNGYNPNQLPNCQSNWMDGTLTVSGWLGYSFGSSSYTTGTDWNGCIS